jgi:hypothetical protein
LELLFSSSSCLNTLMWFHTHTHTWAENKWFFSLFFALIFLLSCLSRGMINDERRECVRNVVKNFLLCCWVFCVFSAAVNARRNGEEINEWEKWGENVKGGEGMFSRKTREKMLGKNWQKKKWKYSKFKSIQNGPNLI